MSKAVDVQDIESHGESAKDAEKLSDIPNVLVANSKTSVLELDSEIKHDFEAALDVIGFGKVQWYVMFTSGFLLMLAINETMGMSIITIASQCDFATTTVDKAVMSAASFLGIFISSYFWGHLSDTFGRRKILLIATFASNVASFVSAFIPNLWLFIFVRFVVGLFIAAVSSTCYAFLGEFFVLRHRPVIINYASMFVGVAQVYIAAVAWPILSMDWSLYVTEDFKFRPWRLLNIAYLLPGLLAGIVLLRLPESPKVLLSLGKYDEAYAAVNWISLKNTGHALSEFKIYKLKGEQQVQQENIFLTSKTCTESLQKMWLGTRPLLKRPHVLNFLISCVIMCGLFVSSSGMGLWYPEIQNRVGRLNDENHLTVCQIIEVTVLHNNQNSTAVACNDVISTKSYIDSVTYGVSFIAGYIVLGIIINPLGRKVTMISSLSVSVICITALHWIVEPNMIVVCFCLYLMLPGLCVSILSGALVDLVPTYLRGKAVCICLMLGRSGSVIGSNVIGILLESNCSLTFSLFGAFVLVCAALTFMLPI